MVILDQSLWVNPDYVVACKIVSSDLRLSFSNIWEIKFTTLNVSFVDILGRFKSLFGPLKHKKNQPISKTCDFTKILEISSL